MSERPGGIVSAAAERARLREAEPAQVLRRRVRDGKPCPIAACPASIPKSWILCEWHWGLVPPRWRTENKAVPKGNLGEHTLRTCVAVFMVYDQLESVGAPRPFEMTAPSDAPQPVPHTDRAGCACAWCGPLWVKARRALDVGESYWAHLLRTYYRPPGGPAAGSPGV